MTVLDEYRPGCGRRSEPITSSAPNSGNPVDVRPSLISVMKNVAIMAKVARLATTPDEMLTGLVRGGAVRGSSRIVQPHFYVFGGVAATARWIRTVIDGNFEVKPDCGRFAMDA
ncbi:MAG: hypothetical protein ACREU6_03780 [Steroidobacteraceae bacterium]